MIDAASGEPVPDARVLFASTKTLRTNHSGMVSEEVDPAPTYRPRAEALGYFPSDLPGSAPSSTRVAPKVTTLVELKLYRRLEAPGTGGIVGRLSEPLAGVLVVAEGTLTYSSITDQDGVFELRGLLPAQYRLEAFGVAAAFEPVTGVSVAGDIIENVAITRTGVASGRVEVSLAGALTGTTAVYLFEMKSKEAVPGISGFASTSAGLVQTGVPPGTYRVGAALEPDELVVNPDLVHKDELPLVTVGATNPDPIRLELKASMHGLSTRTSTSGLVLSWEGRDDADFYVVEVTDLFGANVFGGFDARRNWRARVLHPTAEIPIAPAMPLKSGVAYRARVFAAKDVTTGALFELFAASEEVDGVFIAR